MLEREIPKRRLSSRSASNWTTPRLRQLFQHFQTVEEKLGAWLEKDSEEQQQQAKETLQQMHSFQVDQNLSLVKALVPDLSLSGRDVPSLVLENLVPFFDAGFLLKSRGGQKPNLEQFFFRGVVFPLPKEGIAYSRPLPQPGPSLIKSMAAGKWLTQSGFSFLQVDSDAEAFLFQLLPRVYFVLISSIAGPWRQDHLRQAQRLINNAFDGYQETKEEPLK